MGGREMASGELASVVGWLRDRELIRDVPQRYAKGIDTRDLDLVRSCFHDDAFVKGTLQEAPIATYLPGLMAGVYAYEATMHFMGNQYVEIEPGDDTARVETYAVAYHMEAAGNGHEDLVMGVRYQDTLGRQSDGSWLITRREVARQWHRGPLPRASTPDHAAGTTTTRKDGGS